MKHFLTLTSGTLAALLLPISADITGVTETNLGADAAAIIETGFNEDSLSFSDRTHQHNGAAFEADLLSTTGTTIVGLPSYLIGGDTGLDEGGNAVGAGLGLQTSLTLEMSASCCIH